MAESVITELRPECKRSHATVMLKSRDSVGLMAKTTEFLNEWNINILDAPCHSEPSLEDERDNLFFQKFIIDISQFTMDIDEFELLLRDRCMIEDMEIHFRYDHIPSRIALLVSKEEQTLIDMLLKQQRGKLGPCVIDCVVSNHDDLCELVESFNTQFHYEEIHDKDNADQEARIAKFLKPRNIDLLVTARYMQWLEHDLADLYVDSKRVLNGHHSMLPELGGSRPYYRGWLRGLDYVAATAHIIDRDKDNGWYITSDRIDCHNRATPDEMIELGRANESRVLIRGLQKYLSGLMFNGRRALCL